MTRTADDHQPAARPLLRVVRGDATPEEIAALVAVLAVRGGEDEAPGPTRSVKNAWSDRSRQLRRPLATGPGAWRASGLPVQEPDRSSVLVARTTKTDERSWATAQPMRSRMSSRTRAASAWPRVAFMTAPTRAPAAATLPSRIFAGDVRVGRDRLVDGRGQRAVVADHGQAAGLDHLVGAALAGQHAVEDLAGQLVVERARVDQGRDPGHLRRGDRRARPARCRSRWPGGPARPATTCARRPADAPAAIVSSTRSSAPALTARLMSASDRPHSARSRARRARTAPRAARRASAPPTRAAGATGTRSGSGK